MRNQQLFEAPFVSENGKDDCSKYVSNQWNSRYHWRYCQGTPCIDSNGRQSTCIRPGAGKCLCKRCQGEAPPPLNPRSGSNPTYKVRSLFEAPFPSQATGSSTSTQKNYMDAMTAPPFQPLSGGRRGSVRTGVSSWPSLLKRAIQAIQTATQHLRPPTDIRRFDIALFQAESLLQNAMKEIRRVMSGSRQFAVLDQLGNAMVRIQAARAQARGASIYGGRSLVDPRISLHGAINHIQQARQAVGLQ